MRMTHSEKLKEMHRHMAALGIAATTAAPPAWQLLWRLGIEAPPPLFAPFWPSALFMGSFFGLFWGLFMWLFLWSRQGMPGWLVAAAALSAGALFGLCMAGYFRYLARKHNLPLWRDYAGQQP